MKKYEFAIFKTDGVYPSFLSLGLKEGYTTCYNAYFEVA